MGKEGSRILPSERLILAGVVRAFDLPPVVTPARAIWRILPLRDNPFKVKQVGMAEQGRAVVHVLAEVQALRSIALQMRRMAGCVAYPAGSTILLMPESYPREGAMMRSVKDMLADANATVPKLSPAESAEKIRSGDVLIVDVRDAPEVQQNGKIKGAVNVSRGMLEFRADADSPYHNPIFQKDKTILLHCASGGRSVLAGKTLQEMGYTSVFNIGGFKELVDAGVETEPA